MSDALLAHTYAERARVERLVQHLHQLGVRSVAEFLNELAVEHGIASDIVSKLEDYARLYRDVVHAVGADRFAPRPLWEVEGGR